MKYAYDKNSTSSINATNDETDPAVDIVEARRQNRIGKFTLQRRLIYVFSVDAMRVLSEVLVVMADFCLDVDGIEYTAFCPAFVPVPVGSLTPKYEVEIHDESIRWRPHVSYEERKIKELRARVAELEQEQLARTLAYEARVITTGEESRRLYPSPLAAVFGLKRLGSQANPAVGADWYSPPARDSEYIDGSGELPRYDEPELRARVAELDRLAEWPNAEPEWKPTPVDDRNATPPRRG